MADASQDIKSFYTGLETTKSGSTILVDKLGNELLLSQEPEPNLQPQQWPQNNDWVRHTFINYVANGASLGNSAQGTKLSPQDRFNRIYSNAMIKYTDTSLGGNKYLNPPPAFTRYADIRPKRVFGDTAPVTVNGPAKHMNYGMGRYYSEAIDDNAQVIHMTFGVPSFNSLIQFFTSFYSGHMAAAARAARFTDSWIQKLAATTGNILGLAIAPLFIIPNAILLLGQAARFFTNTPASKFYYLKPAMPIYWMAVTSIVNQLAVNSGLSSYNSTDQSTKVLKGGYGATELTTSNQVNLVGQYLPAGLFSPDGLLDIYAAVNRTNRLDIQYQQRLSDAFKAADGNDPTSYWSTLRQHIQQNDVSTFAPGVTRFEEYVQRFYKQAFNVLKSGDEQSMEKDPRQAGVSSNGGKSTYDSSAAEQPGFFDYFISNLNDGSDWVSFRVDYTGQVTENFSSSVAESTIASKINSMSRSAREMRFNLADGNVGGGLGMITDAVKGVLGGIAEAVHIEGLAAFAGSAFVDIPKMWDESITSLPKSNYNVTLISPYGNQISQLFNIWVPLACLLAGALPLATGKQSHTSPFLCQLHDKGRLMTRLGIIDSMTITRGTSNLGFNNEGHALAMEVSFSVLDLSGVLAVPINTGFDYLAPTEGLFDDENAFSDYLMTLAGLPLRDVIYRIPLLKYQLSKKAADISTYFSASHIASSLARFPGVELLGAAMRGTDKN